MPEYFLADLLENTKDGEWGQGNASEDTEQMLVIRGTDFASARFGNLVDVPLRYIPKRIADRKALAAGDILIETAGGTKDQPTGRTVLLKERLFAEAPHRLTCASFSRFLRAKKALVRPDYLFWYLQNLYARGDMYPFHVQHTGVARFQYTQFANSQKIECPSLRDQENVAAILNALDDKIELNRHMNETLEATARAIFKDWFVDFGPTRARVEGRAPYLAPEIWKLFPDQLDGDGRPVSWNYAELSTVVSELRRGISPAYIEDGGICVLNQKCIRNRQVDFGPSRRHDLSKRAVDGRQLLAGDILVNSTGVGTLGRVAQLWEFDQPLIVDSHVTVVRPNVEYVSPYYLGLELAGRETEIEALGEGSTGQTELSRTRLGSLPLVRPPKKIQAAFDGSVAPLIDRMSSNRGEQRILVEIRNLLLPRLMSGEIRVKGVKKIAELAA